MKVTITKNNRNELLKRNELQGQIEFEGPTPSNRELIHEIAKGNDSQAVIKKISTNYGNTTAKFTAVIYDDAEHLKNIEKITKHQRKTSEEPAKTAGEA